MRSRTGCLTCRQRKLKCDERRPVCSQCAKASRHCEPSSGIAFRHQHNASMNGARHGDAAGATGASGPGAVDSLAGFYSYKNTFDASAVWVEIPRSLTFHHTSDPYAEDWGAVFISDGHHAGSGHAEGGYATGGPSGGGDANGSRGESARDEAQAALMMGLDQIMGDAQSGHGEGAATSAASGTGEDGGFNVRGLEALSAAALYTPPQQQQASPSTRQPLQNAPAASKSSTTSKPPRAAKPNRTGKKSKAATVDAPIDPTLTSLAYPAASTASDSNRPNAQHGDDLPEAQRQQGVSSSPPGDPGTPTADAAETADTAEHKVATLLRQFTEPSQSWQTQP